MANLQIIHNEIDSLEASNSVSCQPEDCPKYINPDKPSLKLFHINIRSINKNFDQLRILLSMTDVKFDIIILTECWLCGASLLPTLEGYVAHSTGSTRNQNDGIVIFTNINLSCKISEPVFKDASCLLLQIGNDTTIVALYRSPSLKTRENFANFINSLNDIYSNLTSKNTVLVGDINIDISKNGSDPLCEEYLTFNATHGLYPTHTVPTRINSCLDHFFTKPDIPATALVLESYITDHLPIVLCIETGNLAKQPDITITRSNYAKIKTDLETVDYTHILSMQDANSAASILVSLVSETIAKNTTTVKVTRKNRILKPWMSPGLLRCIKNRDKLHTKAKKSPDNMTINLTYTRYRNYCNRLLRKLKIAYEKSLIEQAGKDPRSLWKAIKSISHTQKNNISPTELLKITDDPIKSANQVCNFFTCVGKDLATKILSSTSVSGTAVTNNIEHQPNSLVILEVTESEIESRIMELRPECATGWDGISSTVVRENRSVLTPPITHICNLAINTGVFPDAFKKAIIHPIHKGGDRDCVNNYRPISILTAISKILERILNRALKKYLDKFKIIATNQYGFRSGYSTEDAVTDLTSAIVKNLDIKNKCMCVFLDLSKAFDTVSVPLILAKLERLGIRGTIHDIFKDYLTNRKQRVKINDFLSDEDTVTYGVPQGSVLGPTLFLLYINDLCKISLPNTKIFTYADDTAIFVWGPNWTAVKETAEYSVAKIMHWLSDNLLTLNVQKTHYVTFSIRKNTSPPQDFTVKAHVCSSLGNSCTCPELTRVDSAKYLGVYLDSRLRWEKHIETVTSRVRRLIHIFKLLRDSSPPDKLRLVYLALCQSVIQYCIPVWGGAGKTLLLRLERAQRAVLKVMNKKPYRYPTASLYSECKVLTVRQLYVLKSTLRRHRMVPPTAPNARRRMKACARSPTRTAFASEQFNSLSCKLYDLINKELKIVGLNKRKVKDIVTDWLLKMDYQKTEDLLKFTV